MLINSKQQLSGGAQLRIIIIILGLILCWQVLFDVPCIAAQQNNGVIWNGKSDSYLLTWTTKDLVARPSSGKGPIFSLKQASRAGFKRKAKEAMGDEYNFGFSETDQYRILSVVGPFVSMERDECSYPIGTDGVMAAAHPGGGRSYMTIDLRKGLSSEFLWRCYTGDSLDGVDMVRLTDIFDGKEILHALLANTSIKTAVDTSKVKTLKDLLESIDNQYLLNSFAIDYLEGNSVEIKIGISGSGASRAVVDELAILLPVPARWRKAIELASTGREGFLMKQAKERFGDKKTSMEFNSMPLKTVKKQRP